MNNNCPKNSRSRARFLNLRTLFIAFATLAVFTLLTTTAFMAPGAIYTTDSTCTGVDLNIFTSKDAVYLNGGPSGGGPGLPAGNYYVRVTQPDGTLLGYTLTASVQVDASGNFLHCYQLSAILVQSDGVTPGYQTTGNPGGEYKVDISSDPTFPGGTVKSDNFKVKEEQCVDCNPQTFPTLKVNKYYDANANGVNDDSQPITGWKIHIQDAIDYIRFTPVNTVLDIDTYTVTEFPTVETNWLHTGCTVFQSPSDTTGVPCTPGLDTTSVVLADSDNKTVEFGNVCLGAGGGHTLGFWSNKNGQATMNDNGSDGPELTLLGNLNLVGATGLPFDPGNYAQFRSWLLSANATNMAYMLSAQLAAMELNVEAGAPNFVNGNSLVYAPCLIGKGANALGFISINALMTAANTELGLHPNTVAAGANRTYQECLKNALDSANNNLNFAQPTPCPFSFAAGAAADTPVPVQP